ncbi:hypothetical protein AB9K41_30075, partial [Cribrihabitans sp. XS_ASV171]
MTRPAPLSQDTAPRDLGPYLYLADPELRLLSVFDDLRYDRADADMLSGPMRRHAVAQLAPLGFRQTSGTVLEQAGTGTRAIMPKWHALGASPFDIARYTPRRAGDWYILTPTQTACQIIDAYPTREAVERIKELVTRQPVNLLKIADHLERKPAHEAFHAAIGHLKFVQREAVESDP